MMSQLTQSLKHEPFLDNALTRFLLRRAINNPEKVGQKLFWLIKSELKLNPNAFRYKVILKLLMGSIGPYRSSLLRQFEFIERLEEIYIKVSNLIFVSR